MTSLDVTTHTLPTPSLLIDVARVEANLARVASYAATHGLAWRPHVKTHKSVWAGVRQVALGAVGLTCATPREAEVMRGVTDDLLLAYPPLGADRLARTVALAAHSRLGVMLDSRSAAEALSQALVGRGASACVLIEVDAGMQRTGVMGVGAAVELAQAVAALPGLTFDGFGFYPGHLRSAGPDVNASITGMSALIDELRRGSAAVGLDVRTISCGSTPLLWRSHEIDGMTELRAGTAVYFDRTSVIGGVCGYEDCAATVLATVVSTSVPGQAVVDAGVKALGREPVRGGQAEGYACVLDRPEVPVVRLSEEHGILDLTHTDWRPHTGEQVRLLPNHVCVAVHNFDAMTLVHPGGHMEQRPVEARGR